MKYRKKPVVVEAYQTDKELDIETLEGTMHASVGDYIITGVRGEQYPCKPDIFEQTYEPADATTASPWHRVEEPPKWVSVFDDLPRHNAVVVVSDGKRSWDVGQYHFLFKADDRTIWWWKKHTTRKVLWWMYKEDAIPEPPKEDA